MGEKLVRNTSSKDSREWWAAVKSAAAAAPKLTYELSSKPELKQSENATKPAQSGRKKH